MYFVYVSKSCKDGNSYIGLTNNAERRLQEHNAGEVPSTKRRRPFKIIKIEEFPDRKSARKRERYLKTGFGRKFLNNSTKVVS